jgi:hypothetical protein
MTPPPANETEEERKKREEEERKKREEAKSIRDAKKIFWGDKKSKKKLMDEIDNY